MTHTRSRVLWLALLAIALPFGRHAFPQAVQTDPNLLHLETACGRTIDIAVPDTHVLPALLTIRDSSGPILLTREIRAISDPQLSPDRACLIYRSAGGTSWIDLTTLQEATLPILRPMKPGPRGLLGGVTVPRNESSAPRYLVIFVRGIQMELISAGNEPANDLAFSPDGRYVWLVNDRALTRYELASADPSRASGGAQVPPLSLFGETIFTAAPGERLHSVEPSGDNVSVVTWRMDGDDLVSESLVLDAQGAILDREQTRRQIAPRADLTPVLHGPIPWPLAPNAQHGVGNTYCEYQNYGGWAYLHPGIDVFGNPGQAVYAVRGGQVKAIFTTDAEWHWRIAIADSAVSTPVDGFLYAHLSQSSIPVHVGDIVTAGQYLGSLVEWPVANFTHTHFARIRDQGVEWFGDWLATENPHLDLISTETTPPVFERAVTSGRFAFCLNQTSTYQSPTALHGAVDIIVRVGDQIASDWLCSTQEIRYTIYPREYPELPVVDDKLAVRFDMPDDYYQGGPIDPFLLQLLYKDDSTCNSRGDYDYREFYHIITNSDGDEQYEQSDLWEAWDTSRLPDWDYVIVVTAIDVAGNVARDSMTVTTDNNNLAGVPWGAADAGELRILPVRPNPMSLAGELVLELPEAQELRVTVHDAAGRVVRQLAEGLCPAGRQVVTWDARDDSGHLAPAGAYFIRVGTPHGVMSRRVVLLGK